MPVLEKKIDCTLSCASAAAAVVLDRPFGCPTNVLTVRKPGALGALLPFCMG